MEEKNLRLQDVPRGDKKTAGSNDQSGGDWGIMGTALGRSGYPGVDDMGPLDTQNQPHSRAAVVRVG